METGQKQTIIGKRSQGRQRGIVSQADLIVLPAKDREIIVSTVGSGEVFAWSALVPPHTATASVKARTPCHVIAIDCRKLLEAFEQDYQFGYVMMTKAAQVTRDRIARMNIEYLAYLAEDTGGR